MTFAKPLCGRSNETGMVDSIKVICLKRYGLLLALYRYGCTTGLYHGNKILTRAQQI